MKRILYACAIVLFFLISCRKDVSDNCETWQVTYWQGKTDHTTLTSNYIPFQRDEVYCGNANDTLFKGKTLILRKVGNDLYDYQTFDFKK